MLLFLLEAADDPSAATSRRREGARRAIALDKSQAVADKLLETLRGKTVVNAVPPRAAVRRMWRRTPSRVQNERTQSMESDPMKARPRWVGIRGATLCDRRRLARAEVVDEIVAKVNDDIVTKSDLETEEQGALQELYRRYFGHRARRGRSRRPRRSCCATWSIVGVLIQRAGHIFDMTKMQEFYHRVVQGPAEHQERQGSREAPGRAKA